MRDRETDPANTEVDMKFGLQNSVMGWDDPWYPDASRTLCVRERGVFRLAGPRPDETGVHKTVAGNVRRGFSHAARNAAGRTYGRFRAGYGEMRLAIYARQRVRKHQRPALRGDQPLRRAAKTRAAREAVGKLSRLAVRRNGATCNCILPSTARTPACTSG